MSLRTRLHNSYGIRALFKYVLVASFLQAAAPCGFATFPGANGHIAYQDFSQVPNGGSVTISLTDLGSLTSAPFGVRVVDATPSWSPDGSQLAFERSWNAPNASWVTIEIIGRDGTGEHTLIDSRLFGPSSIGLELPTWSADGKSIAFIKNPFTFGIRYLYTINTDGSGLNEVVGQDIGSDVNPDQPNWSSKGDLAFLCSAPGDVFRTQGICVRSRDGSLNRLQLDDSGNAFVSILGMKWLADGGTIAFVGQTNRKTEVFKVNEDGTGVAQVSHTPTGTCLGNIFAVLNYTGAVAPSPDGKFIVVGGVKSFSEVVPGINGLPPHCQPGPQHESGFYTVDASGGTPTLLLATLVSQSLDWQPIINGLSFNIRDGHNNPLKGLKVELRQNNATQNVIDQQPINTVGGTYVFQDGLVPAQSYLVRATLIGGCVSPCAPPFDIRYAPHNMVADEPVWQQWYFTVANSPTNFYTFNFGPDDNFIGTNLDGNAVELLDDMADIYFRVQQYVDWIAVHITPSAMPTASYYTFAVVDPDTGSDDPQKYGSYYKSGTSKIVLNPEDSAYANRDGTLDDDGPFVEWHEFTHYLYGTFVIKGLTCPQGDTDHPHSGYRNPDTCSSMDEGFAEFMPTLASRDILGPRFFPASDGGFIISNSMYSNRWDLQWPTFAWNGDGLDKNGQVIGFEEYAIAALYWDLVVRNGNASASVVIGNNGSFHPVVYTNSAPTMPISALWAQLTSTSPLTVRDFRNSFGNPALTIDLDGDGVPDVAQIDVPFLMHGFYPIDLDQSLIGPTVDFYNLGYAQRFNKSPSDFFVGRSDHIQYDNAKPPASLIPRADVPRVPKSNIALTVLDASGTRLSGAAVNTTINYPGGQTFLSGQLDNSSPALIYLQLPPYFNYPLPDGVPLPACDPLHDTKVSVTLTVVAQGQSSTTSPSFDNCTFWHAVAAATGPAALSFTVTVPVIGQADNTPPITTATLAPQPNTAGWNNSNVTVSLAATDNAGGSGVKQITYSATGAQTVSSATTPGASSTVTISNEGQTAISFFAADNAGNIESQNQTVVLIDKTAPAINCGTADGQWHATDVSIACSGNDGGSGLADASEANFALTTALPVGTETANASTGTHSVCDIAGNCSTAGPIGGNMIDKKPPTITITAPASGTYLLNQNVTASYSCNDGGSGLASCAGSVPSAGSINTATIGSNTFTVNAADKVGNQAAPQRVNYSVVYNTCILYDPTRSVQSGSTIPLKLQLCDANHADVSTSSATLHAISLVQVSTNASEVIQATGDANADNDFRYDSSLGSTGGYIFNLKTTGLSTGSYNLGFSAGADPTVHSLLFQVR